MTPSQPQDTVALFNQGLQQLQAGNYSVALTYFDSALAINPDDPNIWEKRASALQNLGNYAAALASSTIALSFYAGDIKFFDAEAWFEQGNQQAMVGDFVGAIASFDKALEIKPDYHLAWDNRGAVLGNLGRSEEAIASFDKALEIKPDDHEAWGNRGVALKNLGQFEEAIASYDKALQFKPEFHEAWGNRGIALADLGQFEEAIASYDKALQFKPDNHDAWYNRGNALVDLGQFEEAIASYDKALQFKPDNHEAWGNRGNALKNLGQFEEAIASYGKALQFKPDDHQAWRNRGLALYDLGHFEKAIASFDKALEIKPDNHEAWGNRGNPLKNLGQFEEAIASYDKALQFKPEFHEAWGNRGIALADLGQFEEAIASYDKAIELKPDDQKAWNNRGNALDDLGRFEEAIASFDKALQFKPDLHQAWNNRGNALVDLGQFEEAIASYDKALQIQPEFHNAWCNRGVAAGSSVSCDQQLASMSSIARQNPALNQRGYEGALGSYQEGLKYCQQETHPEGWGGLHQSIGTAHYLRGCNDSRPRPYWHTAINSYEQALITLTKDDFPELHLEVLQDYIKPLLGLGQTAEAEELQRLGTDLLRRLLSEPKRSNYSKKQLALKFVSFQQLTVDQAVQSQQLVTALELAEKGKNACLTWLLAGYSEEISSPSYTEIQQLLNPITAIIYWHLSPAALTTFIIKHGAEEPIVIKEPFPSPPVKKRLPPLPSPLKGENERGGEAVREERDTISSPPLLDDTISSLSSPPFLSGVGGDLPPHDKPNLSFQHLHDFETWVNNWNKQYQEYRSKEKNSPPQLLTFAPALVRGKQEYNLKRGEQELDKSWRDNLPEMLEHLGNILNIPAILSELTNINQLILIPHRDLHRFPLHALFPDTFTITYLPSAQIGLTLKATLPSPNPFPHQGGRGVREESIDKEATEETADTNTSVLPPSPSMGEGLGVRVTNARDNLLSVEHPNSEGYDQLPYAELESAAITQLFNNPQRLAGKNATKTAVAAVLPTGYSIFHFTGHGTYNFNCPSQSALILSGKDKLTLEDILRLPLNPYQLVSLSSCETALTGNQTITTEYVGLVSAFLYQRVSHVVSTLWTVESAASALFMIKFYRLRSKGKPEAVALRKTQQWLRQLSAANLARLYRYVIHHPSLASEHNIRPFLKTELRKLNKMAPTDKPYKHPYHWAAFTLTGFYKSDA